MAYHISVCLRHFWNTEVVGAYKREDGVYVALVNLLKP